MRKQLFQAFMALGVLGGASTILHSTEAFAQSSATVGSLRGVLKDKANGEPAVGATVVATSPALVGEQVVITDETGQYFITSLPPGTYTLTIYYNNQPFSRPNVLIQLGKEAVVNVTVDSAVGAGKAGPGEVIQLEGRAPIVDQGSTKTGFTVTSDYTNNIPTGRTFAGVLGSVAGSQGDQFGVSMAGATSAENIYVVEGINTTDTAFGGVSTNLPNEFISETEIITGGYNAEFGRATGGIVNVVTKSGSNQFKGSVFGYYTPGALVASAKTVQREGAALDSETNLDFAYDVGAEIGGPIIKDKLWFHVGINPSQTKTKVTRLVQRQVDEDHDGFPDVDPNTGFTVHERLTDSDLTQNLTTYFFTAKVNGAINQNHQFQVSAFGNPRSGDAIATAGGIPDMLRNPADSIFRREDGAYDVSAKWTSKFNEGKTQLDGVAGFHRGYRRAKVKNDVQDIAGVTYNFERSLFDFAPLEPGDVSGCNDADPNNPYPEMVANGNHLCPVTAYQSQGLGFLEERTNDRASFVAAVTQRVKLAGYHTFKGGIDLDIATYNSTRHFTGDQFYTRLPDVDINGDGMLDSGRWDVQEDLKIVATLTPDQLVDADMDGIPDGAQNLPTGQILCASGKAICQTISDLHADTTNHGAAAFLQDSWQIRPNLTLNAGLRLEQQTGFVAKDLAGNTSPQGDVIPDVAYKLKNELAPRIGFIFDPTQEGKSKVFGHWGRFYEDVPMDLNVRGFGGEIIAINNVNRNHLNPGDPGFDPNCDVDFDPNNAQNDLTQALRQCGGDNRNVRRILGETLEFPAPSLKGQYTQEVIVGGEYELIPDLKIGLSYIHRSLPTVIEDLSTDGGQNYLIANPGGDFSGDAKDLFKESDKLLGEAGCSSLDDMSPGCGNDPDPATAQLKAQKLALAQLQADRGRQLETVNRFDKPVRNYDALQFTVVQRPTKRSLIQASYTYSVSKGNYPGLFSTETGQLDPNLTSLYDLPALMANRYGPMGLDRPHNVKIDGFYLFDLKKAGQLTTGASFRAISGIAHNALAADPIYGPDESYLLPRGALSRSPTTFQTDIHIAYGYKVNKTTTVEGFFRIFNLFNAQKELDADESFTVDSANPIVGGDKSDLAHIKKLDADTTSELNETPVVNKNFGRLNDRQDPTSVQLGFRVTF